VRQLIHHLWEGYQGSLKDVSMLVSSLKVAGVNSVILDHFAVIDLPSKNSGIPVLSALFSELGYEFQGQSYLADKQNDFLWMAAPHSKGMLAHEVLPQVVVADFRLDELPFEVKIIIEKYAALVPDPPLKQLRRLKEDDLLNCLLNYFSGRDWPLPTVAEFRTVREANELLAWVLLFGRLPNHFGLSVHLTNCFNTLEEFIQFAQEEVGLTFNTQGGVIKGTPAGGIIQGSTMGKPSLVKLADEEDWVPERFVEFVWRYPHKTSQNPVLWDDYFTGFIANQADNVIESVYRGV
jgi:hypothetical protein